MEVGCTLDLRKVYDCIQDGQVGIVPLEGFHPFTVHSLKFFLQFRFPLCRSVKGIVFTADILVGAVLQNGLIGKLSLTLRKCAVAPVPLAVADLDLSILAPLLHIVLVNVGLKVLVCVFFYSQVLPVLASQAVYQNHVIFNQFRGHIFGNSSDSINVQGMFGS